jgi:hypothetical protein
MPMTEKEIKSELETINQVRKESTLAERRRILEILRTQRRIYAVKGLIERECVIGKMISVIKELEKGETK